MRKLNTSQLIILIFLVVLSISGPLLYLLLKPDKSLSPVDFETRSIILTLDEVKITDMFIDGDYDLTFGTYDAIQRDLVYSTYPVQLEGFSYAKYTTRMNLEFLIEFKSSYFEHEIVICIILTNTRTDETGIQTIQNLLVFDEKTSLETETLSFGNLAGDLRISFILYPR